MGPVESGSDVSSYKRVKGRSHTVEKRTAIHPQKPQTHKSGSDVSARMLCQCCQLNDRFWVGCRCWIYCALCFLSGSKALYLPLGYCTLKKNHNATETWLHATLSTRHVNFSLALSPALSRKFTMQPIHTACTVSCNKQVQLHAPQVHKFIFNYVASLFHSSVTTMIPGNSGNSGATISHSKLRPATSRGNNQSPTLPALLQL